MIANYIHKLYKEYDRCDTMQVRNIIVIFDMKGYIMINKS